jgi:aspartyl-tRNA synthetase
VTVTIGHPMLFEVYAQVDDDKKETYSSNAVTSSYKNMISDIIMTHGQVLIWQARDDERYMHALRFEKQDLKKNADSVFRVSFVFRWVVGRGKYYIDGPNDGYPVES